MNVKKGDLAITSPNGSKSDYAIQNSGKLVEVLEFVGLHRWPDGVYEPNVWRCRWLSSGPALDVHGDEWSGTVLIADKNLRPIRGQDGDESFLKKVSVDDQIKVLRQLNKRKKERA